MWYEEDIENLQGMLVTKETPEGKEIEVFPVEGTSLWAIRFKPGGQLPKQLSGKWVKQSDAVKEMDKYLSERFKEKNRVKRKYAKSKGRKSVQ